MSAKHPGGAGLKRRLGLTSTIIVRVIGNLVALLINVAAAFILVRKLSPSDYAFYQTLTKRGVWIGSLLLLLLGEWVYRYNAQRIPGSWEASIVASIISAFYAFFAGIIVAQYLRASISIAFLSGLALSSFAAFAMLRMALNALRPLRFTLLNIVYRLFYTTFVVFFVYFIGYGVIGALWSMIIAGIVASFLCYAWGKRAKPPTSSLSLLLREWIRHSFVYVPTALARILASLDALIAYHFWGSQAVAAFFATFMVFSLIRESIAVGTNYVAAYLLQGGKEEKSLQGLVALLALIVPLLVFMASHPFHIVYLINPRYAWARSVIAFHALYTVTAMFEAYFASIASGSIKGRAEETAIKLLKLTSLFFFTRIAYFLLITVLALTLGKGPSRLIAWSMSLTIVSLLSIIGYVKLTPSLSYSMFKRHAILTIIYTVLSYLVARLVRLPLPSQRFFLEVKILALPFIEYVIITYIIIVLITPELRQMLKHVLKLV